MTGRGDRLKLALVVPGGVDRSGVGRAIPFLLWMIERLSDQTELHVFALHQESKPGQWPLLGATVHNAGRRPVITRCVTQLLAEHRQQPFDVVHALWASGPGLAGAYFSMLKSVPMLLTLPGGDLCAIPEARYGAGLSWRGQMKVRAALAAASHVMVQSWAMQQEAAEHGVVAEVLPIGVALDQWPSAAPRSRDQGRPLRLIHVADINRVKDVGTIIGALDHLKRMGIGFHLDQLGQDNLDGMIQRQTRKLGLDQHITFHGHCKRARLRELAICADLMLLSSLHEGGPVAVLEGALAGLPTVGTAVGHVADWAPEAAIAVPVGDAAALADGIAELARDDARRLCLAETAQRFAILHDADAYCAALIAHYRRLASGMQR